MSSDRTVRRLSAILVADIVGYSRLVEADEATTLAAIRDLREHVIAPLIAEHHGRIFKLTGDGAIVEFGSVVEAVSCAVAVQRGVAARQIETAPERRLVFRIGINLGDVVVEGDDLMGDGINIAARLEQLCPPGGVLVSGTAYDHLQGKLGLPLDFVGEQQVKNISRPVRAYRVRLDGARRWRLGHRWLRRAVPLVAAVLLLVVGSAGAWWYLRVKPASGKPSIAVLPFNNLGGSDDSGGRLAAGVTGDIITALARFRDLDVIANNSTDAYKGKVADVRQVGKDLGVRYVLQGSIQREADQVRVNAQLIDAASGTSLWSNRWDRPAVDVFAVQSEVAERVASTLGGENLLLGQSLAAAKRKNPADLEAYDLWALANGATLRGTKEDFEAAVAYCDAAIARDPSLVRAYVTKGWATYHLKRFRKDLREADLEIERLARNAIAIDPYEAQAHVQLAVILSELGNNGESRRENDRALELNPSSADILNIAAGQMSFYGDPEKGAEMCDRSYKLNPAAPLWYANDCAENYFFTGRMSEVIEAMKRIASWKGKLTSGSLFFKAAAEAELGLNDLAATVAEFRQRYPEMSFESKVNTNWSFDRKQEEDRILSAVRRSGIRICATEQELAVLTKTPRRLPECSSKPTG
jgi:TolB-like protein/class 3 adenylate cyclase